MPVSMQLWLPTCWLVSTATHSISAIAAAGVLFSRSLACLREGQRLTPAQLQRLNELCRWVGVLWGWRRAAQGIWAKEAAAAAATLWVQIMTTLTPAAAAAGVRHWVKCICWPDQQTAQNLHGCTALKHHFCWCRCCLLSCREHSGIFQTPGHKRAQSVLVNSLSTLVYETR